MIGFLRGILLEKDAPFLIIEVNGVGYELQIALSDFDNLPAVGEKVSLYIHQVKRDDGEFLYGFIKKEHRSLFRSLIKINGIGPKIALAILSVMTPSIFAVHLSNNDSQAFERVPGIGGKTAKRLIIEMKDKIIECIDVGINVDVCINNAMRDAVSALMSLGYKQHEAIKALDEHKGQELTSEELIKLALRKIK